MTARLRKERPEATAVSVQRSLPHKKAKREAPSCEGSGHVTESSVS